MSKILVVDDSDAWCSAVAAELGKAGHHVIRARHQQEAIEAANGEKPSLVMVDLLVAAKAGAGFVRRMKSLPSMKDTPMLLATVGTDFGAVHQALGVKVNEIISKNRQAIDDLSKRLAQTAMAH